MTTVEEEAKQLNVRGMMTAAMISALALVVGLFWKDAIELTIQRMVPEGQGLFYKYLAAIIATFIAAGMIYLIYRAEKLREERFKKYLETMMKIKGKIKGIRRI